MLLEAIVKCYLRVSIKALIYITQSVIALIRIEPHTISDESRVGRSKDYNYMIFIEKGEASRARALECRILVWRNQSCFTQGLILVDAIVDPISLTCWRNHCCAGSLEYCGRQNISTFEEQRSVTTGGSLIMW